MRINTNISALQSYNALQATNRSLERSINRLSTGLRINSAADDAAGLAISEKMRAQYRGLDRAASNAQDGISMIQTAEGAMNEVHSILQRMRELSVQAANDTLTQDDRAYIQLEVDQLKEEIDRISTTTQFNKKKLLDGSSDAVWSTSDLGVRVNVGGTLLSRDMFGQSVKTEGNWRVVATTLDAGQGQVLKSNVFRHATPRAGSTAAKDSTGEVAGKTSHLADLEQFVDKNGKFILQDPQELTVAFENGGTAKITVYSEDTIGSLGEKLNAAMKQASGVYDEGSLAQWVGKTTTVLNYAEGMFGTDNTGKLTEMFMTGWLEAAGKRIKEAYGNLIGNDDINEFKLDFIWDDQLGTNTLALATTDPDGLGGTHMEVHINDSFRTAANPDWDRLRQTLTHELTHIYQFNQIPGFAQVIDSNGIWLAEGMPEYVAGGLGRFHNRPGGDATLTVVKDAVVALLADTPPADIEEEMYMASYAVTRYFDEQTRANGGVQALIHELAATMNNNMNQDEANAAFDAAINKISNGRWVDNKAFRDEVRAASFDSYINQLIAEDYTKDAGLIGGYYASGGQYLTNADNPLGYQGLGLATNPLKEFGVTELNIFGKPNTSFTTGAELSSLSQSAAKDNTLQSVEGTLLLHSNIAGSAGRMTLSGSEDLIKALGFSEIQSARDVRYEIAVYDAHDGSTLVSGMKVTGTDIKGLVHENIDVTVQNNYALEVDGSRTLAGGYGSFQFKQGTGEFVVHVAAMSTVLQVGANEGETFSVSFGDTGARALGVNKVRVTDRENAARAITIIDGAINTVSRRRARLGAYENRLEHTISNLTASSTNLKASESRIRDLDMAKEMMTFTKLNILSQAGNSMLAQANNLPQNVLSLLR